MAAARSTVRVHDGGRRARRRSERYGRLAELAACVLLMLRGYRILEHRCRTSAGEVDLVAVRGRRLAFVEVKLRGTLEAAQASITPWQSQRVRTAALRWVWRHPRYREHEIGLDAMLLGPGFVPRFVPNALQK